MAKEHRSPEERLLALIRGKHKKPQGPPAQDADASKDPAQAASAETREPKAEKEKRNRPSALFKPSIFKQGRLDPMALKAVNRAMFVMAVLMCIYLAVELFFIKPEEYAAPQVVEEKTPAGGILAEGGKPGPTAGRDYSFYASEISNKDIFGQAPGQEGPAGPVMAAPEEIAGSLSLVGIIAGDPQQAIIEDKKSQKTYYVTKGESFNGLTVDDVSEGKVVIDYQGKKIALIL